MENNVKGFINRFHIGEDIDSVFTSGCCYWFAFILAQRFTKDGAEIMYDQIWNHFGVRILGRVYDITGDVTDKYEWELWDSINDTLLKERVIKDCIMF